MVGLRQSDPVQDRVESSVPSTVQTLADESSGRSFQRGNPASTPIVIICPLSDRTNRSGADSLLSGLGPAPIRSSPWKLSEGATRCLQGAEAETSSGQLPHLAHGH